MNLIEKLGLEKCKQIVDGAPDNATTVRVSIMGNQFIYGRCHHSVGGCILLISDIRTEIANHERTDTCSDIKNHISPNTKVIEG